MIAHETTATGRRVDRLREQMLAGTHACHRIFLPGGCDTREMDCSLVEPCQGYQEDVIARTEHRLWPSPLGCGTICGR